MNRLLTLLLFGLALLSGCAKSEETAPSPAPAEPTASARTALHAAPTAQAEPLSLPKVDPKAACSYLGGSFPRGELGWAPSSLEELIDRSPVIVDAVAQAVLPKRKPQGEPLTDTTFSTTNVLKGADPGRQFVVAQSELGFVAAPGQRRILFLQEEPSYRQETIASIFPEHVGIRRFSALGAGLFSFCVEGEKIRAIFPDNMRKKYDRASLTDTLAKIHSYVGAPRVNGRILVEVGSLPVPGSVAAGPWGGFRDIHAEMRVVLTPEDGQPARTAPAPKPTIVWMTFPLQSIERPDGTGQTIGRDGVFTLALAEGVYRVAFDGLPFGYAVKSMSYGSVDLLQGPMKVDIAALSDLRITLAALPMSSPGVRVTGLVTDATSGDLGLWVILRSDAAKDIHAGEVRLNNDGTFAFDKVPPGRYTARVVPKFLENESTATVVVAERDAHFELRWFKGSEVTGNVVAMDQEGRRILPSDFSGRPLARFASTEARAGVGRSASVAETQVLALPGFTFSAWLAPGEYRVTLGPLPPGYSVKAISSGSTDLLTAPLKIDGLTPIDPIQVVIERTSPRN